MVAPTRRISLSLSSRPWAYWSGVAALALLTGLAAQNFSKPAAAVACQPTTSASAELSGTHGLAVSLGDPALPLHVGDRVDIVGVAANMAVLTVSDTAAVLAVRDADVEAVVAAVRNRATTMALVQRPA
jgi:hypothetical protein